MRRLLLRAGGRPCHAQSKIQIGCTATSDCASAMVAIDEGIFKKHGLEAEMVLIGINSNIPAAILSNSIQIGGPTSTVFLQAADGGLDLVAVGGATVMSPVTSNNVAAFVRNGITINEPKDFVGKKVGAPGLGAFLHVLFVKWLVEKGVDPKSVNFVEVTFPDHEGHREIGQCRCGADRRAVRHADDQCRDSGRWAPAMRPSSAAPSRSSSMRHRANGRRRIRTSSRNFATAIAEAAPIVNSDREKASASISKFTKQPLELVKATPPNQSEPVLKPEQLAWWIDIMSSQKMMQSKLDLDKLILK